MTKYDFMHAHPFVSLLFVDMILTGIYNILNLLTRKGKER